MTDEQKNRVILSLFVHVPFVPRADNEDAPWSDAETFYFETVNETLIPLIRLLDRLKDRKIPFKMVLTITPILCNALRDEFLNRRYLRYLSSQIEFGEAEIERAKAEKNDGLVSLAVRYRKAFIANKKYIEEKTTSGILEKLKSYTRQGTVRIEFAASAATNAFLPFLVSAPQAIRIQVETALVSHRSAFGCCAKGFELTFSGWHPALSKHLKNAGCLWTSVAPHALLLGNPPASYGTFYPAETKDGLVVFGKDYYSRRFFENAAGKYRDNSRDVGHELPISLLRAFLGRDGERGGTGYKYWSNSKDTDFNELYNPAEALLSAKKDARSFLRELNARYKSFHKCLAEQGDKSLGDKSLPTSVPPHPPVIFIEMNARTFGDDWTRAFVFLENFAVLASRRETIELTTSEEYLKSAKKGIFEEVTPIFSSSLSNGYAEDLLDSTNDWLYRHIAQSVERMTEMSERFEDTGIRERFLNQAAREVLLGMSADISWLLHESGGLRPGRVIAERHLRNFTTFYEALGSNHMSARWLTSLETRNSIFPFINYRIFRAK